MQKMLAVGPEPRRGVLLSGRRHARGDVQGVILVGRVVAVVVRG